MASNRKTTKAVRRFPVSTDMIPAARGAETIQVQADELAALAPNQGLTYIASSQLLNGNPAFFAVGAVVPTGNNLNILGATTPLVYYINGKKQILDGDVTLTLQASSRLRYIFALKTSNPRVMRNDFIHSGQAPFWSYTQPVAPAGTSVSNRAHWFDMANGGFWEATAAGGAWTQLADGIFLGVALFNAAGTAIEAILCEPFRLDHVKRLQMFGDGSDGLAPVGNSQVITGANVAQTGVKYTPGFAISGGTLSHNNDQNNVGTRIYSQTPVIITNGGKFGLPGRGMTGGTGSANATGGAGVGGGLGATGGGGGGGVANTGGNAGGQCTPGRPATTAAGGFGGGAGANGNGGSPPIFGIDFSPAGVSVLFPLFGSGGGGGASQAGSLGGNGGKGGGHHELIAPSILLDAGCTASSAGEDGFNGTGTNAAGGGGGGGGLLGLAGGFVANNGTVTAAGGAKGNKLGTGCGDGAAGGNGFTKITKLW